MRIAIVLCALILTAGLSWLFPLFRIVRLDDAGKEQQEPSFNAAEFAESFWNERLLPAANDAPDAAELLSALQDTPLETREKFGRKVGVSRTRLFLLRGAGRIVSLDKEGVGVAFVQNTLGPDVILQTGLLFGNAARDATGLIVAGEFPHSQDFNEISTEINRIIEERVIPTLKERSVVGRPIEFVGCAEVADAVTDPRPLVIVPFKADIQ
jgi:predicted lipoprotein